MQSIPQKAILQMRQALDEMDVSPAEKAKIASLLDKVEKKGGIAPKELKELGKIMDAEEKRIQETIASAQSARKNTDKFIKKTDQIFADYLGRLNSRQ